VLDEFKWIEDYFSTVPVGQMRASGRDLQHLHPIPWIDYAGFATGVEWNDYEKLRRGRLPEIMEPLVSVDCDSREQSEKYEADRALVLQAMKPEIRHRFLVAFLMSSGLSPDSETLFEKLQKLAVDGDFRFANVWKLIDPMQIPGYADFLAQQKKTA
jgi:hypothetical protein